MYNMENNRRSFFKGLAAFASGVVAAKVASYTPKKEEPKEEVFVPSTLTITHEGEQYHPLVVKKTEADKLEFKQPTIGGALSINPYKATLRKADI
jgi:hypothetical protein